MLEPRKRPAPWFEIVGRRAQVALAAPCRIEAVRAVARLPDQGELAGGAALVFDASASEGTSAFVTIDGTRTALRLAAEPATQRVCVPLSAPRLANVAFGVEAFGVCADAMTSELWIDQVRLEADANCG